MPVLPNIPNLHPLVVHFPIALALTALLFRFVLLFTGRRERLEWSATALSILAAAGGAAAWLAGKQAAGSVGAISMAAEKQLSRHADLAGVTVLLLVAAAVLGVIHNYAQGRAQGPSRRTSLSAFLILVLASGFLAVTADLGGGLVYNHGLAVQVSQETPGPAPETAVTSQETPAAPVTPAPIQDWVPGGSSPTVFAVDGAGLILLPDIYDDVAVTTVIDPAAFRGDLAVIHHAHAVDRWEGFLLTAANKAQLVQRTPEDEKILKSTSMVFPAEPTSLRVTAAQGHFKGLVDGDMIVHGHAPSDEPGRVGIYYSGRGTLKITSLEAETASEHQE